MSRDTVEGNKVKFSNLFSLQIFFPNALFLQISFPNVLFDEFQNTSFFFFVPGYVVVCIFVAGNRLPSL